MKRSYIEKYVRIVSRDIKFVDQAIERGAYPSFEELYDYAFKAEVVGFRSKILAKHQVNRFIDSSLARIGAWIFENSLEVYYRGFTYSKARKMVSNIVKNFNYLLKLRYRMAFFPSDKDGVLKFVVMAGDGASEVTGEIVDRRSMCTFLQDLWSFGLSELGEHNKSQVSFLEDHLYSQICAVTQGERPLVYFGQTVDNTLENIMLSETEYKGVEYTPVASANNVIPLKKVSGLGIGGSAK